MNIILFSILFLILSIINTYYYGYYFNNHLAKTYKWIEKASYSLENQKHITTLFQLLLHFNKYRYDAKKLNNFIKTHKKQASNFNLFKLYQLLITDSHHHKFKYINSYYYLSMLFLIIGTGIIDYYLIRLGTSNSITVFFMTVGYAVIYHIIIIELFKIIYKVHRQSIKIRIDLKKTQYFKSLSYIILSLSLSNKETDTNAYKSLDSLKDFFYSHKEHQDYLFNETSKYIEILLLYMMNNNLNNTEQITIKYIENLKSYISNIQATSDYKNEIESLIEIKEFTY